ncbi:tRNA preQ1(34) S-adenosylmethionine ribosyltransferase-isomerase QueA [Reyranella sp. CPCC 100927]|uniref:tRNA preQ1(34) S-adenosylmethionine ribosyltransferase-isomerase QueA n=1 Tax=Reyranella sp. CPCC 100927 TaxID=2599616 RepID=UPI0011B85EE5|nr:tRNA preQ1(34) S-adenosylmethionine ribosyltransferase-isomerase QueA [Reyranella sp. CPCC 100927]TWT05096.1 tRNA preQ1(34) S-adenosylmethionine ribosyltransferase-isomerase QueA [Reyranella sp. CPCC 100927]
MRVDLFDFDLPERLIAQRPAVPRDAARLLHLPRDAAAAEHAVRDLPDLLRPGDLLVFNDTRVIPARLYGRRASGGKIEALLLGPTDSGAWTAMVRGVAKLRLDARLTFEGGLSAAVTAIGGDGTVVLDFGLADSAVLAALRAHGHMPLPPYIRGGRDDAHDRHDYQTVVARHDGAIAAPTAALHFTEALLARLRDAGVATAAVTLHVGIGTFQPVRVDDTDAHVMHIEHGELGPDTITAIDTCRARGGRVIAVGTTSLRVLEAVAAHHDGALVPWRGDIDLFITPGFRFRAVDLLMTNFHLPRSTLFMLVSAFAGLQRMQALYADAIARDFRFYSYGDASLLERREAV